MTSILSVLRFVLFAIDCMDKTLAYPHPHKVYKIVLFLGKVSSKRFLEMTEKKYMPSQSKTKTVSKWNGWKNIRF